MGRVLFVVGLVGIIAALVVGVAGWIIAGRTTDHLLATIEPVGDVVDDVAEAVEASTMIVERTIEAIEGIESATRSAGRTMDSVGTVIGTTSEVVETDLANSVESAVNTLPALVDTSRIIDRSMRALSLVGVDYDPEQPLDQSLTDLEDALRPVPDQLRSQVDTLEEVQTDIGEIAVDAGVLAATLLEARIDMTDAKTILVSTAENVDRASASIVTIQEDVSTYVTLGRVVAVAAAVALMAAALAPLLIGMRYRRGRAD